MFLEIQAQGSDIFVKKEKKKKKDKEASKHQVASVMDSPLAHSDNLPGLLRKPDSLKTESMSSGIGVSRPVLFTG